LKLLDAVVVGVGNIDEPSGVHRNAAWVAELPLALAKSAPLAEVLPIFFEPLNSVIVHVRNEDRSIRAHRYGTGVDESAAFPAVASPLGYRDTAFVAVLNDMVVGIGDVDPPRTIRRYGWREGGVVVFRQDPFELEAPGRVCGRNPHQDTY